MSPTITNKIKSKYDNKKFFNAAKTELSNLQLQLCVIGFMVAQRYGNLDSNYLVETKIFLAQNKERSEVNNILQFVDLMLESSEDAFLDLIEKMRAEPNVGLALKNYSTVLLDTNAGLISNFPMDLQSKIYEIKNMLNTYNQEVIAAENMLYRTYDSSLSEINHQRLNDQLLNTYKGLQGVCSRLCHQIQEALDYKL